MRPGITPDAIRRWAKGIKHDAVKEDELNPDNPGPGDDMLEDEDEIGDNPGERNALWAGEDPRSYEELEMMDEVEVDEFVEWIEEHEPEIAMAADALAGAVEAMDVAAIEAATEQLQTSDQFLNPEYPPMDPGQRKVASTNIQKHAEHGKHRKQAMAIGLTQARRGEKGTTEELRGV